VLLDLAVQGHQVFGQREIYGLRVERTGEEINTVYMTTDLSPARDRLACPVLYRAARWLALCVSVRPALMRPGHLGLGRAARAGGRRRKRPAS